MLHEIYAALQCGCLVLATTGVRTLLDWTMLRLVGDGTFRHKLEKMHQDGHIGTKEHKLLSDLFEIGNAAAHRGHRPSQKHTEAMLDAVENLLERFVAGKKIRSARRAAPERKNRLTTTTVQ